MKESAWCAALSLAVLVGYAKVAFATPTPLPGTGGGAALHGALLNQSVRGEITGIQHATASNGPIVVNWHFKNKAGSANLIVNKDGTYLYSGQYHGKVPANSNVEIVLALRSTLGGLLLFHYIGTPANSTIGWSKQSKSSFLKEQFATFDKPHDWTGSITYPLNAVGQKIKRNDEEYDCSVEAWAQEQGFDVTTPNSCAQFNYNWQ